jgi:hypothetical protein
MLIAVLVPAADADEALSIARRAFDRLVGFGTREPVFESYVTFERTQPGAEPTRWDDLPPVLPVRAEPGASLLERQWVETWQAFVANIEQVRTGLVTQSLRELMQDTDQIRRACYEIGATEGPTVYLYDQYGLGIRHRERLDAVLARGDPDQELWIAPATVRY